MAKKPKLKADGTIDKRTVPGPHQFQPGQSGNPAGRAKGIRDIRVIVRDQLMTELDFVADDGGGFLKSYIKNFRERALKADTFESRYLAQSIIGNDLINALNSEHARDLARNIDFIRYRLRKRLFDIQQRVIDSQSRNIGLMCGRRSGKTETNIGKASDTCVAKPGARVLIIGLTIVKCIDLYRQKISDVLTDVAIPFTEDNQLHQLILSNSSLIQFGGNANRAEREKYLGQDWDLIIIDEAQSQEQLSYFIESILMPMLVKTRGTIMLTGTGPRVAGTYWEAFYNDNRPQNLRLNWDMSINPYIPDHETVLARIRDERQLSESDTLYIREYLGKIAYDTEALVFRMTDANYYEQTDFAAWLAEQSPADVRFTGGLDFGFTDANAFCVICYSKRSNYKWIVYQHKAHGEDHTSLVEAIKVGISFVKTDPQFAAAYNRDFDIWADSARPDIIAEFANRHNLPVCAAIKHDKASAIQSLRTEVNRSWLRVPKGSALDDESVRTVFTRSDVDGLPTYITTEIDDDVYHPDMMDAVLYSMREYWSIYPPEGVVETTRAMREAEAEAAKPTPQQDYIEEMARARSSRF